MLGPALVVQREMSWTALPVPSLPTTAQAQAQSASAFAQSSPAWGQLQPIRYQAPPPSSLSQSAFAVSLWTAPPHSAPAFSQPVTVAQLPSFAQRVAAPQAEADMTMDVDPHVDVAPPRPPRNRHHHHHHARPGCAHPRAAHDPRRAARHLLRVAAVEPALDFRKRAVRRLFKHLSVIRQQPATIRPSLVQDDRAVRKSLVVQRCNRDALRRARRSVRRALRRAPARGLSRAGPAPQLLRRTVSVEMTILDPLVGCADVDVDMDLDCGGESPAVPMPMPTTEPSAAPAIPIPPNPAIPIPIPIPSEPAISVNLSIPIIIVTPDSPLPGQQLHGKLLRGAAAYPAPAPQPAVAVASALGKDAAERSHSSREESSLDEFEVPLVEAAGLVPAPVPVPASASDTVPERAAVIPEAAIESQPSAGDDAGEASDDGTEWESVPVPTNSNAPAARTADREHVCVEESANPARSAERENASTAGVHAPPDVPAPNVAEPGPVIVFRSTRQKEEEEDAVSLGYSEDEAERWAIYGEDGEDEDDTDDEDYEDEDEYEDEEEESEEESEEEEVNNEYNESAPINGPVKRTLASASIPPIALLVVTSDEASASPTSPVPTPNVIAPSSNSASLTGGPYIGFVAERYDESTAYSRSMELLTSTVNVSSGARLSDTAAQEARAQARLRNHASQVKRQNAAQDLIRSIAGKSSASPKVASAPMPDPVPFE